MVQGQHSARETTLSRPGLRMHCRCNAAGKLWQRTDSTQEGSHVYTYGYDARGRLASVHKDDRLVERYAYNALGQSVTRWSPYTARSASAALELHYDAKGRLESDGKRGFGYDKHGSLSEIWDGDGQTRFTYKHSTVLDTVRFPNGTQIRYEYEGAHPVRCYRYLTLCAEYQWDKEGRLVLFREHDLALTMHFSYTAEGHTETVTLSPMAETHAQTFPEDTDWKEQSRDWLYVASGMNRKKRIDGFLQGYTLPLRLRCACDQVGTLRVLTDPHGQVIKSVTRDSFGNLVDDSFPDLFVPLGFAGGLEDRYTGFTRFGWREYDPVAGRFVCKDPAKDLRGDADLYDYCADDPVNYTDREGTYFFPLAPLIWGKLGGLTLGLGAAYGTAKLVDTLQEKRTSQPSTAARDGVKQAAGPTAVTVGMGTAGGALAALTPALIADAMMIPNFATTALDIWLAMMGPALPPPTSTEAWAVFLAKNYKMFPEEARRYVDKVVKELSATKPHTGACTPQTQPRDDQGRFAPCEHSKP